MCSCQDYIPVSGPVETFEAVASGNTNAIAMTTGGVLVSEVVKGQLLARFPVLKGRLIESVPVTYETLINILGAFFGLNSDSALYNGFGASMAWAAAFRIIGMESPVKNPFTTKIEGFPARQLDQYARQAALRQAQEQAAAQRIFNRKRTVL